MGVIEYVSAGGKVEELSQRITVGFDTLLASKRELENLTEQVKCQVEEAKRRRKTVGQLDQPRAESLSPPDPVLEERAEAHEEPVFRQESQEFVETAQTSEFAENTQTSEFGENVQTSESEEDLC